MKKTVVVTLDRTDLRIIQLIQENARMPVAELAQQVGLSASTCARRLRLLEDGAIIRGYSANVDPAAVGLPMTAVVRVSLNRRSEDILAAFETAISKAPEVMEAFLMTGRDDYMLRVAVKDLAAYERFLKQRLTRIPGVSQIESSFVLRQVAARSVLPIAASDQFARGEAT
ncbi:MAG: Lrp/AsnC family transcriptional regulator [Gammaproteobacteria bacterium]